MTHTHSYTQRQKEMGKNNDYKRNDFESDLEGTNI